MSRLGPAGAARTKLQTDDLAFDVVTQAEADSGLQPFDSDLTAIAALATTAFGRALLTAVAQTALTQTYDTADATLENPTAAAVATTAATAVTPFGYSTGAQANAIVTNLNALRQDVLDLAQFVNAMADRLQAIGAL